jgi:selenophosphate synthase
LSENFWENIELYRNLGFDPVRWIPSCSNEIEGHVLKCALAEMKHSRIKISPFWFDSFYHIDGKIPELTRRVYSLANPVMDKEVELKRALAVLRIHTGSGEDAPSLSKVLENFFRIFSSKVQVTNASAVLTEHKTAEFGMFDYIQLHRGDKVGYMPAVTSVTQVTDVTKPPDSEIHSNIAMTSAIELLNLLGCNVKSSPTSKLFPIYDAPTEDLLDKIRSNLDAFTSRYNIVLEDYSSLKLGKLFYGTSAVSTTTKDLPTRYDQIEEGMEIIITNKFGGLSAVGLYTLACMEPENITKYEKKGIQFANLTHAKNEALTHIAAVYPVGSQGVFALRQLAEVANIELTINQFPLRDEEIARFATNEFLVENATTSLNGCHVLIAGKDIANLIMEDLRKHNFAPERIGFVQKRGSWAVKFDSDISQYVASKARIARLMETSQQQPDTSSSPSTPASPTPSTPSSSTATSAPPS